MHKLCKIHGIFRVDIYIGDSAIHNGGTYVFGLPPRLVGSGLCLASTQKQTIAERHLMSLLCFEFCHRVQCSITAAMKVPNLKFDFYYIILFIMCN